MAGDLGNPFQPSYRQQLLEHASHSFHKVFIITGNHEYYGKNLDETDKHIRTLCQDFLNVTFLNNSFEVYDGVHFIGSTLWSHISDSHSLTTDFYVIQNMTIPLYNKLHSDAVTFIDRTLSDSENMPVVVITHHLPSHHLVDPCYHQDRTFEQCFASRVDHLIRPPVVYWIYGHTHKSCSGMFLETNIKMRCDRLPRGE